jgi:DNA-directed RNA polymerase subunit K/omega
MTLKKSKIKESEEKPKLSKEDILERAPSAYEAVVAIAKEARRLNTAPEVYLDEGEKAIPKAVKHFVNGTVEYEVEEDTPPKKGRKKSRKKK